MPSATFLLSVQACCRVASNYSYAHKDGPAPSREQDDAVLAGQDSHGGLARVSTTLYQLQRSLYAQFLQEHDV